MIGPILGAVTGIIGAISQQRAQQEQIALQRENLEFQKANADRQFNLATAERTDAFGNTTGYDPVMNEWELDLSPEQAALMDAFEMEQTKSLTEDATRGRDLRRRQEDRSKAATPLYEDAVAEYMYSPNKPESVGSYTADAQTEAAIARRDANKSRAMNSRTQAIRMGQGGDLEQIMETSDKVTADQMVSDILRSKQAGRQAHATENANWESTFKPRIEMFGNIMNDIGPTTTANPDTAARMDSAQRSMLAAISAAMGNESSQVGNAYGNLATAAGQGGIDLSGVASALASMKFGSGTTPSFGATQVTPSYYAPAAQEDRIQGGFTTRYV